MFEIIIFIVVGYLIYSLNAVKKSLVALQNRLDTLESSPTADTTADTTIKAAKSDTVAPAATSKIWKSAARKKTKDDEQDPIASAPIPTKPKKSFVFNAERFAMLARWLRDNWFYAVAALSLALSGVFFVQYGIENGYLTPFWRVMGALGLGTCLIIAGEFVRRRTGDEGDTHTEFLPSVFSGAGLVALFAGVLSARQLYGLIGVETAFVGLVAIGALAVILGWFYGPLLAAIGLIGANAAPFLVGDGSPPPPMLYYFFGLIAIIGLLIDALRRWAWVSVLALVMSFGAAFLLFASDGENNAQFIGVSLLISIAAILIPRLQLWPTHTGSTISSALRKLHTTTDYLWPEFPTRLAAGALITALVAIGLVLTENGTATEHWVGFYALFILIITTVVWTQKAPALRDLAILPIATFLGAVLAQIETGAISNSFHAVREPESAVPWDVTILLSLAALGSILMFWRSLEKESHPLYWAAISAIFAPLAVIALELGFDPVPVLGASVWAWHAMAIAGLMVLFALQSAKNNPENQPVIAGYATAAMVMISYALIIMLSDVALTIALAVMVILAALMDRKFNLRLLSVFVQIGGILVAGRLVIYPGLFWAIDQANLWEIVLGYGGSIAAFAATWIIVQPRHRTSAIVVMESAVWTVTGVFASVLLFRYLDNEGEPFWVASLFGTIWLISMANQIYRLKLGGKIMRWLRYILATLYGLVGFACLGLAVTVFNPLVWRSPITGPMIFDTLLIAYIPPALTFAVIAWRFKHLRSKFRITYAVLGTGLGLLYLALEIRRFWQGDVIRHAGFLQGELYSYTIAMLLLSVGLLFFAFSKRSTALRKIAVAGVALTIAKVFLIDMAGLQGLIRVASFLGLGLSLAGLAWINRRMDAQWDTRPKNDANLQ